MSQIITTKEQSEKLISLGLDPKTGDMVIVKDCEGSVYLKLVDDMFSDEEIISHCWVLSSLIELLPEEIESNGKVYSRVIDKTIVLYVGSGEWNFLHYFSGKDIWESVILAIEGLKIFD